MLSRRSALRLSVKIVPAGGPPHASSWDQPESDRQQSVNTVRLGNGHVDLSSLPSTIPGVTREELAEKLRIMESHQRQQTVNDHRESISKQIDTMRRAMPPDQFKEFLRALEEKEAKTMEEAEKLSAMTPTELYRYQLKQHRRESMKQWVNLVCLAGAFVFGIYFIFYFLLFFFY